MKTRQDQPSATPGQGPALAAVNLWDVSGGKRIRLLTDEERARLAVISSIVRFKKGAVIYERGDRADAVFNIIRGVVKSYSAKPDGSQHISAFLFPDDLVGLAEEGRYRNSAKAVTAVTAYRMPAAALEAKLMTDPGLEFHVICKLCHELREAQKHAFLLSNHRALLLKVALFLQLLASYQGAGGNGAAEVDLPMSRTDIGDYIGVSPEAVSRSFRRLVDLKIIAFRDRRHVTILDAARLEQATLESSSQGRLRKARRA